MVVVRDGKLWRDGQPFASIGFNYHPSVAGCQYWRQWDAERIEADLRRMAQYGFNTVRFFVFWADFEPAPGQYDPLAIERLKAFVVIARRYDIYCIPALLTIWMNGQLFDLPWRAGRNLWADPEMVRREVAYVQYIATALRDADNVLAYDLGDEVIHVDFAQARALSRAAVVSWQSTLAEAIRAADPDALVLQGQEASSIFGDHAFRAENAQALDLIAIHGFPTWSPLMIESISSYKASSYVPFLVQMARLDGTAFVDELGSYGAGEEVAGDYLRATAHSVLANGAAGVIVWCWQDFLSEARPFDAHPGERFVGLLAADGRAKPAMNEFRTVARHAIGEWAGLKPTPAPIGVYVPSHVEHAGPNYLRPRVTPAIALFYAYALLKRAHLPFEFTRGALDRYRLVICPSVEQISLSEQRMLADYVTQGGVVYYSAGEYLHGFGGEHLFGVTLHDFSLDADAMARFTWQEQDYALHWSSPEVAHPQIPIIRAIEAEVLATFPNGTPALTCRALGRGKAYYLNAPLERQLNTPFRLEAAPWHTLYSNIARAAGIQREIDIDAPEVELAVLCGEGRRYGFIINHSPYPIQTVLARYTSDGTLIASETLKLAGKDVRVIVSTTSEKRGS